MLTKEQQRWYAEHGTPQEKAFAGKYGQTRSSPGGLLRSLVVFVGIAAVFALIPTAIFLEGRLTMFRHLTGSWIGTVETMEPDGAAQTTSLSLGPASQTQNAEGTSHQPTSKRDTQIVLLEVHRSLVSLFSRPALAGTIHLCDGAGHRTEYPFHTDSLGVDFLRFTLPAADGLPERTFSAALQGAALHIAVRYGGSVAQGDLNQKPASTFQASCRQLAQPETNNR